MDLMRSGMHSSGFPAPLTWDNGQERGNGVGLATRPRSASHGRAGASSHQGEIKEHLLRLVTFNRFSAVYGRKPAHLEKVTKTPLHSVFPPVSDRVALQRWFIKARRVLQRNALRVTSRPRLDGAGPQCSRGGCSWELSLQTCEVEAI